MIDCWCPDPKLEYFQYLIIVFVFLAICLCCGVFQYKNEVLV